MPSTPSHGALLNVRTMRLARRAAPCAAPATPQWQILRCLLRPLPAKCFYRANVLGSVLGRFARIGKIADKSDGERAAGLWPAAPLNVFANAWQGTSEASSGRRQAGILRLVASANQLRSRLVRNPMHRDAPSLVRRQESQGPRHHEIVPAALNVKLGFSTKLLGGIPYQQ